MLLPLDFSCYQARPAACARHPKYQNLPKISKLTQNIAICSKYYNCPQISQFAQIITICPICLKCTQNITIYSKCSSLLKIPQFALNIIICSISKKITKTHMHCTFPALLHFSQFFLNIWQFLVTSYISYTLRKSIEGFLWTLEICIYTFDRLDG